MIQIVDFGSLTGTVYGYPICESLDRAMAGTGSITVEVQPYSVTFYRDAQKSHLESAEEQRRRPDVVTLEGRYETTYSVHPEMVRHVGDTWGGVWTPHQKAEAAARAIITKALGVSRRFVPLREIQRRSMWPFTAAECALQTHLLKTAD